MLISTGELASGRVGKSGMLRGVTNFFAVHMLWGVVLARKLAQWEFFALLIALKYPCLESQARATRSSVPCFLASLDALAYSLRRVVRRGVHQGFDLGEGREVGVWRRTVAVRVSREWANHVSNWSGEGERGGGGMRRCLMRFSRLS